VDYQIILDLMKEMNNTDLTKLEIEEEGTRICMEKASNVSMAMPIQYAVPQVNAAAPALQTPQVQPLAQSPVAEEKPAEDADCKKILSPMVGTFYAQSSPDKPPFVKVGDKVKKGQTLCIIEAMKLMNEIESEYDGEIVKVFKNNEEMVEFGQPLFVIK
jgi:acetyl-CoA carboxylase biotin carboxyl carrier protein